MNSLAKQALALAKSIQQDSPSRYVPPSEGTPSNSEMVLPHALVRGTRGYVERITNQVNGSYEHGWFDGCAVMMRRLIETLIIEAFEHHGIAHKIKNPAGDFLHLADLVAATLSESTWNLGRNAKKALPKLKEMGDQSAHSRRFVAHREDIDKVQGDFRTVIQELVYLAGLK